MLKLTTAEEQALVQANGLIKFAAEHYEVTESVVTTIATAQQAAQNDQWTPEIAAKFWTAYNSLCEAIKPVTLDSILSNESPAKQPTRFWRSATPPSKRSARLYLVLMILSLVLSVWIQFVISNATTLATDMQNMMAENDKAEAQISREINAIRVPLGSKDFSKDTLTPEEYQKVSAIQDKLEQIWVNEDKAATKFKLFRFLTSFGAIEWNWNYGTYMKDTSIAEFDKSIFQMLENRRYFSGRLELGLLITNVMNSLLPLLLGFVGASAYVTRLISDQIKGWTFSSTSPVRHLVRVFLGALAGVIVGFGWLGSAPSASPLALAFIAGYAIEPVFSTIDSISEKFRQHSA